jgi:selenocysteine lyase/cysteine desulfurase
LGSSCGKRRGLQPSLRRAGRRAVATMILDVPPDFGAFGGRVWLNCAHQAPLPNVARVEAEEAVAWKAAPWDLTTKRFSGVPRRLKQAIGRLIGAPAGDVILANSASYGLHLIANGFPWRLGDGGGVVSEHHPDRLGESRRNGG